MSSRCGNICIMLPKCPHKERRRGFSNHSSVDAATDAVCFYAKAKALYLAFRKLMKLGIIRCVYMNTFCSHRNEFILIDESEHSLHERYIKWSGCCEHLNVTSFWSDLIFWHAHTAWILSFPLLSHIVLKSTLDIYLLRARIRRRPSHYHLSVTLESSKSAPSRDQNQSSVDESLRPGLVRRCAAPLHRRWVKAEF